MGGSNKPVRSGIVAAVATGAAMCVFSVKAIAVGPSFTIIPPAADESWSVVSKVSGNGVYVCGQSGAASSIRFWTWTRDSGRNDVPMTPGWNYETVRVIANNGTVAGEATTSPPPTPTRAVRRPLGGSATLLGPLESDGTTYQFLSALGISDDGSTVIGRAGDGFKQQAWVSRNGSPLEGLGWLTTTGERTSTARAVSTDGSVIVGTSTFINTDSAFEYRGGTMRLLPSPSADVLFADAECVTGNGDFICGSLERPLPTPMSAVIWGPSRVPFEIGHPDPSGPAISVETIGIADNASLLLLSTGADTLSRSEAWVWAPGIGYRRLFDYATSMGVTIPGGFHWNHATSMSRDGRTFTGYSYDQNGVEVGWVLTVPCAGVSVIGLIGAAASPRRRRPCE